MSSILGAVFLYGMVQALWAFGVHVVDEVKGRRNGRA